jgi:hypothetical protein
MTKFKGPETRLFIVSVPEITLELEIQGLFEAQTTSHSNKPGS